jgi:hypothetical protein
MSEGGDIMVHITETEGNLPPPAQETAAMTAGLTRPYDFPVMGNVRVEDDVAEYLFIKYGIVQ